MQNHTTNLEKGPNNIRENGQTQEYATGDRQVLNHAKITQTIWREARITFGRIDIETQEF